MAGDSHDGKGVGPGFPETRQHGMPQRMYHEVRRQLERRAQNCVLVIERRAENWRRVRFTRKHPYGSGTRFASLQHFGNPRRQAEISFCIARLSLTNHQTAEFGVYGRL